MEALTTTSTVLSSPATVMLSRSAAEDLGRRLQGVATARTTLDHDFIDLVDQFDSGGAVAWFDGIGSVAHYLAFACSLHDGTAREHVRVARALRCLPRVRELFAEGRLSYSKVRELTRVADDDAIDEQALCALALEMTASQLARTVSSYRTAAGTRIRGEQKRRFSSHQTPDGMVRITVVLGAEEAALVHAAIEAAQRRAEPGTTPTRQDAGDQGDHSEAHQPELEDVPAGTSRTIDSVSALLDVAASYLEARPSAPADDHTLVVVQVSAEQLGAIPVPLAPGDGPAQHAGDVPAGTSDRSARTSGAAAAAGVLRAGTCEVVGQGPIEAATAQRLVCTASLLGAVVDRHGEVLALGRTARLASRAQRRALTVRDKGVCQFPGCTTRRHLDAHHLVPWSQGGRTDLDDMILLCRRHHVGVHEGGLIITRTRGSVHRFHVAMPDGTPVTATWRESMSSDTLLRRLAETAAEQALQLGSSDPTRIFPPHAGAGFSLHECVEVLFRSRSRSSTALAA